MSPTDPMDARLWKWLQFLAGALVVILIGFAGAVKRELEDTDA